MAESHRDEITRLETLYAGNPGGRVFVHLAEALRKAGEHVRARGILEDGLARHPDSASGFVVLGRVLADLGFLAEAESAFRRVLELDAGNFVALRGLGDLAREAGRIDEAVECYRDLLARNPSNDEVRELLDSLAAAVAARAQHVRSGPGGPTGQPAGAAPARQEAAPGDTGAAVPAEPDFGFVDIDALPGDLASFAGLRADAAPQPAAEPDRTAVPGADPAQHDPLTAAGTPPDTRQPEARSDPAPHDPPTAAGEEGEDQLATETLADVYLAQGLHAEAARVYRALLRRRPADPGLLARLDAAEAAARSAEGPGEGSPAPPAPAAMPGAGALAAAESDDGSPVPPAPAAVPGAGAAAAAGSDEGSDEGGEDWVRGTGTVWTRATVDESVDSPYAWGAAEPEPELELELSAEAAPPIAEYLRTLVGWLPSVLPPPAARSVPLEAVGGEIWPSGGLELDAPAAADMPDQPLRPGVLELDTPATADMLPGIEPEPGFEPVAASAAVPDLPPPAAAPEPPADPWASADPWAAAAAAPPPPAPPLPPMPEQPAPSRPPPPRPQRSRAPDPVEAAFDEWYGDPAAPPAGAAVAAAPAAPAAEPAPVAATRVPAAPSAAPPAAPPAVPLAGPAAGPAQDAGAVDPVPQGTASAGEDDEDLAMFRSWLQSLKK
jgi:tetratricopeptide (TPR) repeat protein